MNHQIADTDKALPTGIAVAVLKYRLYEIDLVVNRALRDVRHIVVGFDDSAHARRAVELISSLSPPRGGRVSLFTAVDTMHVPSQALVPPDTRAAVSAEVTRINKERVARAHQALDRAARLMAELSIAAGMIQTQVRRDPEEQARGIQL